MNIMEKIYDIVVIGESMAGKSTYIASLMEREIEEKLKSICEVNKEGQTKIPVHYILDSNDKNISIENIKWNNERKEQSEEADAEIMEKLFPFFPSIKMPFEEYFRSEEYEKELKMINTISFVKDVVNDLNIGESNLIQLIEIKVPASLQIRELMRKYKLEQIKIRDTRGFIDETLEKFKEMLSEIGEKYKNNKSLKPQEDEEINDENRNKLVEKYLFERGMTGADATILVGKSGSNALNKVIFKELYADMIKELIKTGPLFTLIRTDSLFKILEEKSYQDAIAKNEKGKYINIDRFTGNKDSKELLSYCGIDNLDEEGNLNKISKKYHTELLLPDISYDDIEELEHEKDIYLKAVNGSFGEILSLICDFRKCLNETRAIAKEINENYDFNIVDRLKKIYDEAFNRRIEKVTSDEFGEIYKIDGINFPTSYVIEKACKEYLGGMVGVRGGLTTKRNGVMVGDVAMELMEYGYVLYEEILEKLLKEMYEPITRYARNIYEEDEKVRGEVEETIEGLRSIFKTILNYRVHTRYCTCKMLNQYAFEKALESTKEKYQLNEKGYISHCLPELQSFKYDRVWAESKKNISVIKTLIWNLIEQSQNLAQEAHEDGWI